MSPSELKPYDAIDETIWTTMGKAGTLQQQASWDTDVIVAAENN
jgi:hypothetical protein